MGNPAQVYLYNPFAFGSTDPVLEREVSHARSKQGEKARTVLQSSAKLTWEKKGLVQEKVTLVELAKMTHRGGKPLEVVKKKDILIINGHGGERRVVLGYKSGSSGSDCSIIRMLTASQLAKMIKGDGLLDGHEIIKLNSCWGAGGGKKQNVDSHNSFASQLARELGRIGYTNIRVGGYYGGLQRIGEGGKKLVIDDKKQKTPASQVDRLWFGPDGQEVKSDPYIDKVKKKKDNAREIAENLKKKYDPM